MQYARVVLWSLLALVPACGPQAAAPSATPTPAAIVVVQQTPITKVATVAPTDAVRVAASPPSAQPKPASPSPAKPTSVPQAAASPAAPLPIVERSRFTGDPAFLTNIDIELEFAEPVQRTADLERVIDGVLSLEGVAHVRSDGKHLSVRYDSQRVLPDRIRDRLRELGHPATAGTDVQNPGDAAD